MRASLCFKLFSVEHLVENNMYYMNLFEKTFGQSLFDVAMKMTVYGQFVAGEDKDKIKVKSIFTCLNVFWQMTVFRVRLVTRKSIA